MLNIGIEDLKIFSTSQNVLIVEDTKDMQLLLKKTLSHLFKNVEIASDGKEALQKYEKGKYHIILSDIEMPIMDGIEFLKEIRKNDLEQKVIFMSAYNDSFYYNQLLNASANGFLFKPILMDKLIHILYVNCKNVFEKEEDNKKIKELNLKNIELTKSNLKFRYLYKKLYDKIQADLDLVTSKRRFKLDDLYEIENSEIKKITPKIENQKPLLDRHKISAKEFLENIEFFKFENEMREDLDEMQDLEEDIKLLIDNYYDNNITPEAVDKIVTLFEKYAEILNMLTSFNTIEQAIKSLVNTIKNIDLEKINQDSKTFLDYIYMMVLDLKNWKNSLFIKQDIKDIHYLDDSLLNNCVHIEQYISGEKKEKEEVTDDDNMFFF